MNRFDERQQIESGKAYRNGAFATSITFLLLIIAEFILNKVFGSENKVITFDAFGIFCITICAGASVLTISSIVKDAFDGLKGKGWGIILCFGVYFIKSLEGVIQNFLLSKSPVISGNVVGICIFQPLSALLCIAVIVTYFWKKIKNRRRSSIDENKLQDTQEYSQKAEIYDERQLIERGKASRNGFYAMTIANVTVQAADLIQNGYMHLVSDGDEILFRIPSLIYAIIVLGIYEAVFDFTAILKDAYDFKDGKRAISIPQAAIMLTAGFVILLLFFFGIVNNSFVFIENGVLQIAIAMPVIGLMSAMRGGAYLIKYFAEKSRREI